MSNIVLTNAGITQIANKQSLGMPLLLKKIAVSPTVATLDPAWVALPNEHVDKYVISSTGKLPNEDAVLYSAVLDQTVGDFDISLVGYYDEDNVLIIVDEIPTFTKRSGVTANIFRHNAVLDFSAALNAMPLNMPTAQFHPETKAMDLLRSEMAVTLDAAITAAETASKEIPSIYSNIGDLESRQNVLIDALTEATETVVNHGTLIEDIQSMLQTHEDNLEQQVKSVVINEHELNNPALLLSGPLVKVVDDGLVFEIPEEEKGVLVRFSEDEDPVQMGEIQFVTDDFIQVSKGETGQLQMTLSPERLKGFGTIEIYDGSQFATLNADSLDDTLSFTAGEGIQIDVDDKTNTLTFSNSDPSAFRNVLIVEDEQTTTLKSEDGTSLRLVTGSNIDLEPNSETNAVTVNAISFSGLRVRATDPSNDATLSAKTQDFIAFEETETVKVSLVGYGEGAQAIRLETDFPEEVNKSFTIKGGNLLVREDTDGVGGTLYCDGLHCKGEITGFSTATPSSKTLKDNLNAIPNALADLETLTGYRFVWNEHMTPDYQNRESVGLLAEEVQQVLPEAIAPITLENGSQIKGVNYDMVVPLLVQAVKELSQRVRKLEEERE